MASDIGETNGEAEIRALVEERIKAVRAKDVAGLTFHHAPDVLSFDVVNPLASRGVAALRKRTAEWFASFDGPISYEIRDLDVAAGDDVGFCHSLNRVAGIKTDGAKIEMWWRATTCFRKIGGRWQITHEHSSVPFDARTGKASLDLKP